MAESPAKLRLELTKPSSGFKGQARVILPTMTSCIECQLDMHAPRAQVPLCTIATIPRQPQHCIEWAHQIAWSSERKGKNTTPSVSTLLKYPQTTSSIPTILLIFHGSSTAP